MNGVIFWLRDDLLTHISVSGWSLVILFWSHKITFNIIHFIVIAFCYMSFLLFYLSTLLLNSLVFYILWPVVIYNVSCWSRLNAFLKNNRVFIFSMPTMSKMFYVPILRSGSGLNYRLFPTHHWLGMELVYYCTLNCSRCICSSKNNFTLKPLSKRLLMFQQTACFF